MEDNEFSFHYTYSAERQEEVRQIREKCLPKEVTKLDQVRQLDRNVTRRGRIVSCSLGTLCALVLGIGMCCTMVWQEMLFVPGVVIGCVGLLGGGLMYPLYLKITDCERRRIAPEILRLTGELLEE